MARENVTIQELEAFRRDLTSCAKMLERAITELESSNLESVLGHKVMVERDYLPALVAFASDIMAKAIQTSIASQNGTVPRVELDKARAKKQADVAKERAHPTPPAAKKRAAK